MPHAFAEVKCSCSFIAKYHCHSHDKDGYLKDFKCPHFRSSVFKRAQIGLLLGFDQLAGLYFNITCLECNKQKIISYEAKTFGKENKDDNFKCCGNIVSFHFHWDY